MSDVFAAAEQWLATDPDKGDRAELRALVEQARSGDTAAMIDLHDRFRSPLTFGTAGLRGQMGAGPNRMNTAVVTTASAGVAAYLAQRVKNYRVVIGFDGRHRSESFARTAAAVIVAAGGTVSLMPRMLPTPVLAFAVRYLDADAGIMVTASHNPANDNGYKVYLGARTSDMAGAQLVSPADSDILAHITAAGPASVIPRADEGWSDVPESVIDAYVSTATTVVPDNPDPLRIVLTPMHGVGGVTASRVFHQAGFTDVHLVASQKDPHPDFPTVRFPNPEEPGALAEAISTAEQTEADIIVAVDPDADRCCVAVPDGTGRFVQLSGDELGALLGDTIAQAHPGQNQSVLARSLVSSSLLGQIAEHYGVSSQETLTGFKWIARPAGLIFGYEEAIGYCVNPDAVRDKDGITAGLLAVWVASVLKADGRTLLDALDDLALVHGLYYTSPLTFRVDDIEMIRSGMSALRESRPNQLAGSPVTEFVDLADGWNGLPATDGVRFVTAAGDKVVARPSGTEPKLKCYLEVVEPVSSRDDLPRARRYAQQRIAEIKDDLRVILQLG